MALISEDLQARIKQYWEQFQESAIYVKAKETYENLTPPKQKLTLIGIGVVAVLLMAWIPLSSLLSATSSVSDFEARRDTIRELFRVTREAESSGNLAVPPSLDEIRGRIDSYLQSIALLPEQMLGIENFPPEGYAKSDILPATNTNGGLRVTLAKLNLRQIIDVGYQFQTISPSVKVKDMNITANKQDGRYFDVVFKLWALNILPEPVVSADTDDKKSKGSSKKKSDKSKGDEN